MANATHQASDPASSKAPPPPPKVSYKETMEASYKAEAERLKIEEEEALKRATGGYLDEEMTARVLSMGGDITRASPVPEQLFQDPIVPGLTTTTGVPRTPMDPTTAAVPSPKGAGTVGTAAVPAKK